MVFSELGAVNGGEGHGRAWVGPDVEVCRVGRWGCVVNVDAVENDDDDVERDDDDDDGNQRKKSRMIEFR